MAQINNNANATYEHVPREEDIVDEAELEPSTSGTKGQRSKSRSREEDVRFRRNSNRRSSMKVMLPYRRIKDKEQSRLDTSGFFATLMYSFLTPLFMKAFRGKLNEKDVLRLQSHRESGDINYNRMMQIWQDELEARGEKEASFNRAMYRFVRTRIIIAGVSLGIGTGCGFLVASYIIYQLIDYLDSPDTSLKRGLILVACLVLAVASKILFNNFNWYICARAASRMRSALLLIVYGKIVRVRANAEITTGEIINLCVNDIGRVHQAITASSVLVAVPILIFLVVGATIFVLGPAALVGALTVLFFLFIVGIIVRMITRVRQGCVQATDHRVRLMTEFLTCVKFIKMYAWEQAFAKCITDVRQKEMSLIFKSNFLQNLIFAFVITMPLAATMISLVTHSFMRRELNAAQAYTTLMLFMAFSVFLFLIPFALKPLAEAIIVGRKLQKFILMEECTRQWSKPADPSHALVITNATIGWELPTQQNTDVEESKVKGEESKAKGEESKVKSNDVKSGDEYEAAATAEANDEETKDHETGGDDESVVDSVNDNALNEKLLAKEEGFDRKITVCLRNVNLTLEKGQLVGICGNVGSGKTSILSAILDENRLLAGNICADGSFAYVAQQAWVMNATVRENILFGGKFKAKKYESVLHACSLKQDLELMDHGDQTEIGERGTNLSGGQKQRISLARALYSDRDIYLLDDPLSALDSSVGQHIFTNCLIGALADKTVLFVTHQLQYLRDCDRVILIQQGRIAEQGTHEELMGNEGGDYAKLINEFHSKESGEEASRQAANVATLLSPNSKEKAKDPGVIASERQLDVQSKARLIEDETTGTGVVQWASYKSFGRHAGGCGVVFLLFLVAFLGNISSITANAWIGIWLRSAAMNAQPKYTYNISVVDADQIDTSTQSSPTEEAPYKEGPGTFNLQDNASFYVGIYIGLLGIGLIFNMFSCFVFVKVVVRACNSLHNSIFSRLCRSPMSFFDTTPLGRILNRFSKDLDVLDSELCSQLQMTSVCFGSFTLIQLLFCLIIPWYIPAFPVFTGIIVFGFLFYRRGVSQFRRMESISQSLLLTHITTTLQGTATVAAFNQIPRFTKRFTQLLNHNVHFEAIHFMGQRWMAVRTDCVGTLSSLIIGLLVVLTKGDVSVPIAALVLFYGCVSTQGLMQHMLIGMTEIESSFISVERILEYIKIISQEAPCQIEATSPTKNWPSEGRLAYKNVQMKYRDNLPLALNDVSFHVAPRERIGIVGRTGSGKSSLGVSLFRLAELGGGSITIDDVIIGDIGLHQLRSKISIIPQDPVLFIGTIRYNLDPLQEHKDIELWAALEKSHMKSKISDLDGQLDAAIVENGDNFSVGERQLLCMARALLRNSKILLLDEATAAIDTQTDSLIQTTIRQAFTESTMLIIAHRLHTVLDCNRILVMDNGQVAEYDEPKTLLENPSSKLSEMMKSMNQ